MSPVWDYLLHRIFGIGHEGADHVRMGAGLVALTTTAFVAVCAAIGGVCWALSHDPYIALGVTGILASFGCVFLVGTWRFADKHPDQAALGGSSWLRLRLLEMQNEAKGQPLLPTMPSTTDPLKKLEAIPDNLLTGPDKE